MQSRRRLPDPFTRLRHGQGAGLFYKPRKVRPCQVLHDQKVRVANLLGLVHRDDVGMHQSGSQFGLAKEPLHLFGFVQNVLANYLEDDQALQEPMFGLVNRPHSAHVK